MSLFAGQTILYQPADDFQIYSPRWMFNATIIYRRHTKAYHGYVTLVVGYEEDWCMEPEATNQTMISSVDEMVCINSPGVCSIATIGVQLDNWIRNPCGRNPVAHVKQ